MLRLTLFISIIIILNLLSITNTQHLLLCESLNDIENNENDKNNSEIKIRRVRALCDAIYPSRLITDNDELDSIPDFDLTQLNSDDDANQILKRFRRRGGRGGGGGGGRGGGGSRGGGGRFSSSFSRSSSSSRSGGSRFFGSRSSSSSSSGSSRFFGSRSSSSSSGSSSGISSRVSGGSSSSSSGFRFWSRSSPGTSSSNTGNRVREAFRTMIRKPSSGSGTAGSSGALNTGGQSRIRETVHTMFRHSSAGSPSASGGLAGAGGNKPGLGDKIRQITQGVGGGGIRPGIAGSGFGTGGSGGSSSSSSHVWVRAGKKFLPQAARYGVRYYQRRKYNKGMYAGMGYGAGYYSGSRMGSHHVYHHYPNRYYDYPPVSETRPEKVDGKAPTVFYCIQEDLNATLVNQTLNDEGYGVCNISGKLVACPIEIECQTKEADTCCEDEQGTPFCCGGPIPEEFISQYGGYGDDLYDTAESINKILNIITATCVLLATICFTMWHRRGQ